MRRLAFLAALSTGALLPAEPRRTLNTFELIPKDGTADIEWVSPSTFRFVRTWAGRQGTQKPVTLKPVPVSVADHGSSCTFETRYLAVRAIDESARIEIRTATGAPLTEFRFRREGNQAIVEHTAGDMEHFYGLGARTTGALDARGLVLQTRDPFLLSSFGYGEFYSGGGGYSFDVAASDPRTVRAVMPADRVELFFYYGPAAKEILEEHSGVCGAIEQFYAVNLQIRKPTGAAPDGSWKALGEAVRSMLNGSLSAKLLPSFNLAPYAASDETLFERAAELASLTPVLYAPPRDGVAEGKQQAYAAMENRRKLLEPYLLSYAREARDRGFPVIRPLVMDYDRDASAAARTDEFLVGDELLVAPVVNPSQDVSVYFPKGFWTDLNTGQTYKGRQQVAVRAAPGVLPMFARNGTIVPLSPGGRDAPMELHYFPSLGAEFFLAEDNDPDISQFHAAPAGDLIRLETESRADRVYEWVLHQSAGWRSVESGGKEYARVDDRQRLAPGTWHFDAARQSVRIRVRSSAGGDEIVNVGM